MPRSHNPFKVAMMEKYNSPVWAYFRRVNELDLAECLKCDSIIKCTNSHVGGMVKHYKNMHSIDISRHRRGFRSRDTVPQQNISGSVAWDHFTRVDQLDYAKCRRCNTLIKCKDLMVRGMVKHLRNIHNVYLSKLRQTESKNDVKMKPMPKLKQSLAKAYPRVCSKYPCSFCKSTVDEEVSYGGMYTIGQRLTCHHFCLLLSNNLYQNGRDDQGILGFMPVDIKREAKRSSRIFCVYCLQRGATLKCCHLQCDVTFHLPCGKKHGVLSQFYDNFQSFCVLHRPNQKIPFCIFDNRIGEPPGSLIINLTPVDYDKQVSDKKIVTVATKRMFSSEIYTCGICWEHVTPMPSSDVIWPPCCQRDLWFHRICVEKLALSAGKHFLRCPLCNNQPIFLEALLKYGFYVPDQDASWEKEAGAFSELLERPKSCYVKSCKCPRGRKYNKLKWQLVFCKTCGSKAAHKMCISTKNKILICSRCRPRERDETWPTTRISQEDHNSRLETFHLKKENDSTIREMFANDGTEVSSVNPDIMSGNVLSHRSASYLVSMKNFVFLATWRSFGRFIPNVDHALMSCFSEDDKPAVNMDCLDLAGVYKNDWELSIIWNRLISRIRLGDFTSPSEQTLAILNSIADSESSCEEDAWTTDLGRFFDGLLKRKRSFEAMRPNSSADFSCFNGNSINCRKKICLPDCSVPSPVNCDDFDSSLLREDSSLGDRAMSLRFKKVLLPRSSNSKRPFKPSYVETVGPKCNVVTRDSSRIKNVVKIQKIPTSTRHLISTRQRTSKRLGVNIKFDVVPEWENNSNTKRGYNDAKVCESSRKAINRQTEFHMKLKLKLKGMNLADGPEKNIVNSTVTIKNEKCFKNYNLFKYFQVDDKRNDSNNDSSALQASSSVKTVKKTVNSNHISVIESSLRCTKRKQPLFNSSFSSTESVGRSYDENSPKKNLNLVLRRGKFVLAAADTSTLQNDMKSKENMLRLSNVASSGEPMIETTPENGVEDNFVSKIKRKRHRTRRFNKLKNASSTAVDCGVKNRRKLACIETKPDPDSDEICCGSRDDPHASGSGVKSEQTYKNDEQFDIYKTLARIVQQKNAEFKRNKLQYK